MASLTDSDTDRSRQSLGWSRLIAGDLQSLAPGPRSDEIIPGPVEQAYRDEPRSWYLEHPDRVASYWLSCSSFVSTGTGMASHLMRRKKPLAIGVKWRDGEGDAITNMEGALHTFVTPLVRAAMHGDYVFRGGHAIHEFPDDFDSGGGGGGGNRHKVRGVRAVIVSGLVHLDFELRSVMWEFLRADDGSMQRLLEMEKSPVGLGKIIDSVTKQDNRARQEYDERLKCNAWRSLLLGENIGRFADSFHHKGRHVDVKEACRLLKHAVDSEHPNEPLDEMRFLWLKMSWMDRGSGGGPRHDLLSLHLMFLSILHQVRNEHAALGRLLHGDADGKADDEADGTDARRGGYVYTYDPPNIFRMALGSEGSELLTLVHAAALRHLRANAPSTFDGMAVFAYNDFASPTALELMRSALRRPARQGEGIESQEIAVVAKSEIFRGGRNDGGGLYSPPARGRGCWLVLHNNSDGFGNNVEFEQGMGSMDAVVGAYSSMAASLRLHEPALVTGEKLISWDDGSLGVKLTF